MSDSIDRTLAIATLVMAKETGSLMCKELKGVIEVLNRMPPAQPEIIMCADCQKYIDYRCRDEHANLNDWRHEDDYCSFGKRREEKHETD